MVVVVVVVLRHATGAKEMATVWFRGEERSQEETLQRDESKT